MTRGEIECSIQSYFEIISAANPLITFPFLETLEASAGIIEVRYVMVISNQMEDNLHEVQTTSNEIV
jgi:hypothetical protein